MQDTQPFLAWEAIARLQTKQIFRTIRKKIWRAKRSRASEPRSSRISARHRRGNVNNPIRFASLGAIDRLAARADSDVAPPPARERHPHRQPVRVAPQPLAARGGRALGVREARVQRPHGTPTLTPTAQTTDRVHIPGRPQVTQKTRQLNEEPDKVMLAKLRVLEKKMGLVLTLVRPLIPVCVRSLLIKLTLSVQSLRVGRYQRAARAVNAQRGIQRL